MMRKLGELILSWTDWKSDWRVTSVVLWPLSMYFVRPPTAIWEAGWDEGCQLEGAASKLNPAKVGRQQQPL